jgi:hypothetical protein
MVRLTLFLIASFSFFALVALNFLQEEPWSFFFVIWTTFFVGFFLHFLVLWFWWLFGAEIILVEPNSIKCYLCLARFRLWRKFSAKGIIQIYFTGQFANDPIDEWGMYENGYGFKIQRRQYALALKHGGKTYRFARFFMKSIPTLKLKNTAQNRRARVDPAFYLPQCRYLQHTCTFESLQNL